MDFGAPVGREQSGHRPAVVISADPLNASLAGVVIVIPTTTAHRGLPIRRPHPPTSLRGIGSAPRYARHGQTRRWQPAHAPPGCRP